MTKNHHPLLLYNSVNDRNKWTQKQEEKSIITDLDNYFSNKHRIYVGDSNYSDSKMLKFLINQNDSFLMRLNILNGKREIHVNNMKYNTNDLIELQKECTTKTFQSKYKNKYGTATISKIEGTITGLETPLTFIIATFEHSEPMVFITNLNCFNLDAVIKLYHKYMERWTIEDVFKCLKTEYQLENYTFRKFQSIQNLLHLLRFVFNILSSILNKKEFCQDVIKIADGIRKKIKFIFQRLSVGIKKVLKNYNSCFFEYF